MTRGLNTAAGVKAPVRRIERPDAAWVRSTCPLCGEAVISNTYHIGGRGYVIFWECWAALGEAPGCDYRIEWAAAGPKVLGCAREIA